MACGSKPRCSRIRSIVGDRVQLQQVLMNLIMNGIEAMADSTDRQRRGQSDPRRTSPGCALVAVEDLGPGLTGRSRIGCSRRSSPPTQGMGIGLSICRSIIDAHGGRLWASPNAPNDVFQFTLPAAAGAANRPDETA